MLPLSMLSSCRCYSFDDNFFEVDDPVFDFSYFSRSVILNTCEWIEDDDEKFPPLNDGNSCFLFIPLLPAMLTLLPLSLVRSSSKLWAKWHLSPCEQWPCSDICQKQKFSQLPTFFAVKPTLTIAIKTRLRFVNFRHHSNGRAKPCHVL